MLNRKRVGAIALAAGVAFGGVGLSHGAPATTTTTTAKTMTTTTTVRRAVAAAAVVRTPRQTG